MKNYYIFFLIIFISLTSARLRIKRRLYPLDNDSHDKGFDRREDEVTTEDKDGDDSISGCKNYVNVFPNKEGHSLDFNDFKCRLCTEGYECMSFTSINKNAKTVRLNITPMFALFEFLECQIGNLEYKINRLSIKENSMTFFPKVYSDEDGSQKELTLLVQYKKCIKPVADSVVATPKQQTPVAGTEKTTTTIKSKS